MSTAYRNLDVPKVIDHDWPRLRRAIEELAKQRSGGVLYGHWADMPAAGVSGRIFWPDNSRLVYRDNGSSWDAHHPDTFQKVTASYAQVASFTQHNFVAGTSVTQGGADAYLATPADAAAGSANLRILYKAVPTLPYTITAAFLRNAPHGTSSVGLVWLDSTAPPKIHGWVVQQEVTGLNFYSGKWTDANTFSAVYNADYPAALVPYPAVNLPGMPTFMRIREDNTNRYVSFSYDGINFVQDSFIPRTDFITATRVGVCWQARSTVFPAAFNFLSYNDAGGL